MKPKAGFTLIELAHKTARTEWVVRARLHNAVTALLGDSFALEQTIRFCRDISRKSEYGIDNASQRTDSF
jgi:hypothetical protein